MSRKFDLALEVERWRDIDKVNSMSLFATEYVNDMSPTKTEIKFLENYFEDRDDEDYRIVMFIKEEMRERGLI